MSDQKQSPSFLNHWKGDGLSFVRLERIANELELSFQMRDGLRHAVLDGIDAVFQDVKSRKAETQSRQTLASTKPQKPEDKPDPYSSWTVEKLEYHIRRAVEADVAWDKIEPYAWKMYDIDRSAVMAGRIVELAYLQGRLAAAISVMESLSVQKVQYFKYIHERLKCPLIINLWCRTEVTLLEGLIDASPNAPGLIPLERYFAFWHSLHGEDPGKPIMYFQKHKAALMAAAEEYGDKVGFTKSRFMLVLGRLHLELGMEENARLLLEEIDSNQKEYADALEVLLKLKVMRNSNGHSVYAAKLNAEPEWQKRVLMIRQFFADSRRLGGFRDRNRPALNEILFEPLKWMPKTVDAWSEISGMICENIDLSRQLPELTRVFRENAFSVLSPELDKALWMGPIQCMRPKDAESRYLIGIAKLHYYLASGSPSAEDALWEAKELISSAHDAMSLPYARPWQEFHRFAYQHITKCIYITDKNREQMIRQLKVATDPRLLAMTDVSSYIEECVSPSPDVLTNLQYIARERKHIPLEVEIILKRADQLHLTNRDLENVWMLAIKEGNWDLAWRSVSVLQMRIPVKTSIAQAWKISGEKRSFYPLINVSKKHVWKHFEDFTSDERKLVHACLEVGPYLPDLLHLLDKGSQTTKPRSYRADSVEGKSQKFIDSLPWLPVPKKVYQFSLDGASKTSSNLPSFLSTLPGNQWSFVFQELSNRIGVTAWNWRLSRLHGQIEDIIPRLVNRQDLAGSSTRIAKWMKSLSPEAKSSWYDIAKLSSTLPDEQATLALYRFLIRLTTLLCVNHVEALKSLYAMKVPVGIIWEFENWILGTRYSQYRAALGLESKVSVPRSLRNLSVLT